MLKGETLSTGNLQGRDTSRLRGKPRSASVDTSGAKEPGWHVSNRAIIAKFTWLFSVAGPAHRPRPGERLRAKQH
ncbi:MAG: hypothetical protein U1D67_06910 [Dehalococcoidia bacterium]|nr:hypothetical protein [Dehalococcoidia bacterium]MDZ4246830.1 hypothetical protein [Dehalococcoidia bacterium]